MVAVKTDSELSLARLAVDLGAETTGGPLAGDEIQLIRRARALPASDSDLVRDARARIRVGEDPLGDAFAALRTPVMRRSRGQFWTPPTIVGPMLDWALAATPTRFVDPGCGSGRFSASIARRDPAVAIVAVDLDPLATLLTRGALAVLGAKNAHVICGDYLTARIPEHAGKSAWVGNPPYVRHHDLTPDTKAWAARAAGEIGSKISGLAGLHALFFLATVLHGRRGDVGSFVTSAEWLDVGYGSIIRDLFVNGMGGRALDLVDPLAVPFDDVMTTALITCFELGRVPGDVAIQLVDEPEDLAQLEGGRLMRVAEMAHQRRWSHLFRETRRELHDGLVLGDIARVHRGVVTGANAFFVMTRAQAARRGVAAWVKPAITNAVQILGSDGVVRNTPDLRVVLDLPAEFDRSAHPDVDAYLRRGEEAGVDERYITTHRKPWWRVGIGRPAPIVASYMARQPPKFALNPDGVALLNVGHGIHPKAPMTHEQLSALAAALNGGRASYAGAGRTYHGGLEKFEPREMEALPIPVLY
ncbi:MAG TPA: methyltransferase [Desulfobacterales bacterium]|nr:methyltransferase [Desulfobacterales bacterium]